MTTGASAMARTPPTTLAAEAAPPTRATLRTTSSIGTAGATGTTRQTTAAETGNEARRRANELVSRILIVEDEVRVASFLEKGLRANGFSTSVATGGREALALASGEEFDLVVLDLGLPDLHGAEVLRQLREAGKQVPVIVLTARTGVTDTVAALEGGADDYVSKPFRFDELLARVRVRLGGERVPEETLLRVGDAVLDLRTRRVQVGGRGVELTALEFAMAEVFFRHPGQVLSRQQLLSQIWGYDYDPRSNVVDVCVGSLRRKLGKERIATVRGMGYRLVNVATPRPPADGSC
jgi:DNA-binding response OmpR family regulator